MSQSCKNLIYIIQYRTIICLYSAEYDSTEAARSTISFTKGLISTPGQGPRHNYYHQYIVIWSVP